MVVVVLQPVSTGSVSVHGTFITEYDLPLPLLSDNHGTVSAQYGVPYASGRPTSRSAGARSSFPNGTVFAYQVRHKGPASCRTLGHPRRFHDDAAGLRDRKGTRAHCG